MNGHPFWCKPVSGAASPTLVVRNSLTDTKEVLIPAEGNIVRMYVCGPTVYDVSHMGHARTFLCFDILRRILEKYFRFNVLYQLNITDIDDKIILKARKQELLRLYKSEGHSFEEVRSLVDSLIVSEEAKLAAQDNDLKTNKPSESSREFAEWEVSLKQVALKFEQIAILKENVSKLNNSADAAVALIDLSKDLIMNKLDSERGKLYFYMLSACSGKVY